MKIKALIVDDVELARNRVRMLLDEAEVEIVGEADNGGDAVAAIYELKPELVFLDVQMPEMNGFEVIETVGVEEMPAIIFTTAFDRFALQAFETNAVDYLLKPFDKERLTRAVERARRTIERRTPDDDFIQRLESLLKAVNPPPKYLKRIPIKSARGTSLVAVEEIKWITAAGHYVELHTKKGETHIIRRSITRLEERLDPDQFVRVHRSSIVNIDYVQSLHPLFSGDHLIILKDGTELNMSRTYHENLMSLLDH